MNSRGLTCFSTKTSTSLVNPLLTSIFLFSWLLNGCGGGSLPAMPVVAPPPATTSNLSLSITSPMTKMSAPSPVHVSGSTQGGSVGTRYEVAVDGQVAVQGEGDAVEADLPLTIGKHSITVMASDSTGAKAEKTLVVTVPAPRLAYVLNADNTISTFTVNAGTGQLTPRSYFKPSKAVSSIAVVPLEQEELVLTDNTDGELIGYKWGAVAFQTRGKSWVPALPRPKLSLFSKALVYQTMADWPWARGFKVPPFGDQFVGELDASPFATKAHSAAPITTAGLSFSPNGYAYLANPSAGSVEIFRIESQGELTSVALEKAVPEATATAIDAMGRFLCAAGRGGDIALFTVKSDGRLVPLPSSPLKTGVSSPSILVSGPFLFVGSEDYGDVKVYRVNPDKGAVLAGSTLKGRYSPLVVDPSGNLLIAAQARRRNANDDDYTLESLRIDAGNGSLIKIASIRTRGNGPPRQLEISAGAKELVYVPVTARVGLNNGSPQTASGRAAIATYAIDPARGLLDLQHNVGLDLSGNPQILASAGATLLLSPDTSGRNLVPVVSDWGGIWNTQQLWGGDPRVFALSINGMVYARGCLGTSCTAANQITGIGFESQVASTATFSGYGPSSMVVDPLGEYLIVTEEYPPSIRTLRIDPASNVPAQASTLPLGEPAIMTALHPSGKYAYALSGKIMSAYRVAVDGSLQLASSSAFPGNKLLIEPTGRFAVGLTVASPGDGNISGGELVVYRIDQKDGSLKPASRDTYTVGAVPYDIAIDKAGRFLYVGNGGQVSIFRLDSIAGGLQEVAFSPVFVATTQQPFAATITIESQLR